MARHMLPLWSRLSRMISGCVFRDGNNPSPQGCKFMRFWGTLLSVKPKEVATQSLRSPILWGIKTPAFHGHWSRKNPHLRAHRQWIMFWVTQSPPTMTLNCSATMDPQPQLRGRFRGDLALIGKLGIPKTPPSDASNCSVAEHPRLSTFTSPQELREDAAHRFQRTGSARKATAVTQRSAGFSRWMMPCRWDASRGWIVKPYSKTTLKPWLPHIRPHQTIVNHRSLTDSLYHVDP